MTNAPNQDIISPPAPTAGSPGSPPKKLSSAVAALLSVGIGCAAILIVLGVAGTLAIRWLSQKPENIVISATVPEEIRKGRQFAFDIAIRNTATVAQQLHSIDVHNDILAAVDIKHTNPPIIHSHPLPVGSTSSYQFMRTIPAGRTVTIRFHAEARRAGHYQSFADICINSGHNFLTLPIGIIIEE